MSHLVVIFASILPCVISPRAAFLWKRFSFSVMGWQSWRSVASFCIQVGKKEQEERRKKEQEQKEKEWSKYNEILAHKKLVKEWGYKELHKKLSKDLQSEMKRLKRQSKRKRAEQILEEWKDVKKLETLGERKKKQGIDAMRDSEGRLKHDPQEIADALADFYHNLYSTRRTQESKNESQGRERRKGETYPRITAEEVKEQIRTLKKNKAADSRGVSAELIINAGDKLIEKLAEIYTSALDHRAEVPKHWQETMLRLIHKGGDSTDPST